MSSNLCTCIKKLLVCQNGHLLTLFQTEHVRCIDLLADLTLRTNEQFYVLFLSNIIHALICFAFLSVFLGLRGS